MATNRVYIGRLSSRAREEDVEKFFEGYGRVRDINLKNGYGFVEFDDERDADDAVHDLDNRDLLGERVKIELARGTPRSGYDNRGGGYRGGYDNRGGGGYRGGYDNRRGYDSYGSRDRQRPSYFNSRAFDKYGPPTRTEYRCVVENLSTRVSWQDLKDYLRQAGQVTYADAHKDKKNEGTVEFASYRDMKTCIDKLDDTEINGRRIRIIQLNKHRSRSRSRSHRSRSRSPSPRRSRSRTPRRDRSRSKSGSRGKYRSRSRDKSRSRSSSRSRSKTPDRSRDDDKSARSRSPERERSRSRSRSASYEHANGGGGGGGGEE